MKNPTPSSSSSTTAGTGATPGRLSFGAFAPTYDAASNRATSAATCG